MYDMTETQLLDENLCLRVLFALELLLKNLFLIVCIHEFAATTS